LRRARCKAAASSNIRLIGDDNHTSSWGSRGKKGNKQRRIKAKKKERDCTNIFAVAYNESTRINQKVYL